MPLRVVARGYGSGKLLFTEHLEVEDADDIFPIAMRHVERLVQHALHMIEIEFLDTPPGEGRFMRMGTDSSMMVVPVRINSSNPDLN